MKMRKNWKRFWALNRHHAEGFTLVELIVVIAILAILGGVAVPAYSGYVKKAERAADEQLLAAVNQAFASACATNGTDNYKVKNLPTFDVDTMTLDHEYKDDFDVFFAGNEGTFKVFPALYYSKAAGAFGPMSDEIATLIDKLKETYPDAVEDVVNSIFNTIGYDALAGQIDNAANLLAGFVGQESSGFHALLTGDANLATLGSYVTEEELDAMVAIKLEQINSDPAYADLTEAQKANLAQGQILANTAILTAAQNSNAITSDFITSLETGNAVELLKGSTDGGNASSDTIAQAAFAYAMYTSYKASIGENVSGDVNIGDVYETLSTDGFMNYMKNDSAADQAGYHGAMELIAGSANNVDNSTAADILLNGFNSDELVGLMQNVTN